MSIKLSARTLPDLANAASVPSYSRSDLKADILHFGVGNFHRAHQAVYLDALFNAGLDRDWAVVGASVREADEAIRQKLKAQDWLSTVVEQEADAVTARVTGALVDYVKPGDAAAILDRLADPAIRIVTLTVTEGGYYIDPASGTFDAQHPEIVWDARHIESPRTVFGLILAGLMRRRDDRAQPFTVVSCDNLPGNGHVTSNAIIGLAALVDRDLAAWVDGEVAFPNGMVDRITPATSQRELDLLRDTFGIDDNWPVFCESFKQWVLEDRFTAGRPGLEEVGVTFVGDVGPYELMKLRILNGGHATIAYPAALMDIHFVHEAMADPLIRAFLDKVEREEIIPVVPPVPDTDLSAYYALVARRFANPRIGDTIPRLCFDGSNRQPKFILPTAAERLGAGLGVRGLALVSALWARYCYGETESGQPVAPNDPSWDRLKAAAARAKEDPSAFLGMEDIFGALARDRAYGDAFTSALRAIWSSGTRATLRSYLSGDP